MAGKPLGISLGSFVAVRTGIARLPAGVAWRDLVGAAAVAGIGFTVSLFVAELAFASVALVTTAKIGILSASILAGAVGYGLLRLAGGRSGAGRPDSVIARSPYNRSVSAG